MSHDAYDVLDDYGIDAGCPQVEKLVAAVEALRDCLNDAGLTDKGHSEPLEAITEAWAKAHIGACEQCTGHADN